MMVSKEALMPRLRFPEFRDSGEWDEKPLGDCLDYLQPTKYLVSSTDYDDIHSTPVLTAGKTFVLGYTKETTGIFRDHLPVIIFDDFTTASKFVDFPFKAKSSAMKILLAKGNTDIKFIYEAMQLIRYEVGVHERHWISIFSKLSVPVPEKLEEQKKIANCFSSLDALITAQAEKINALKTHKKGLVQKLFPHEGETVPQLRFPKFRDAEEWVSRKVSELVKKTSNPVTVEENKAYREVGIRSHGKGIFHKSPITGKELGNKRVFWIEENAFIVNIVFAWELAIANTTKAEKGMIASHRFPMYRPLKNKADVKFMKYFFLTHKGKELLWIASPGGAGRNKTLGQKDFENLELLVPPNLREQQKIADSLSSLDTLIAAQSEKLDALKAHKKGLMQQIFPVIGGVVS